jgi:hypothetical protein
MKHVILVLTAVLSLWSIAAMADEALPEIAPTEEMAPPAIDAAAVEDAATDVAMPEAEAETAK